MSGPAPAGRRIVLLLLRTYAVPGGLEHFNRRLIASLDRLAGESGMAVECRILGDRPADLPTLANVVFRTSSTRAGFLLRSVASLLRGGGGTVLAGHVNLLPVTWLARLLRPGLTTALFVHGDEVWGEPDMRPLKVHDRFMARRLDRVVSVSRHTARVMARVFGLDEGRFLFLPNAVDPLPHGATPRPAATGRHVLTVARVDRLDRRKHVDAVIRAAAMLKDEFPDMVIHLAGDGCLRGELEELARRLGLGERARFHGRVTDQELQALYAQARLFVLPSSKEGFGIVFLEAWQHGLPVICGAYGASPEVVENGVDGFVVDHGDIAALAGKMRLLLGDDGLSRSLGDAGRRKVEERYLDHVFRNNLRDVLAAVVSQ